jgi:glucosamine-6-phosphate deaminase
MGAELVYQAGTVLLLANGERKTEAVARSLLEDPSPEVPISYGQKYAAGTGDLIYVLDRIAARELLAHKGKLKDRKIKIEEPG